MDMPRLLREIVARIIDVESDLEIVDEVPAAESLASLDDHDAPDVVIAAADPDVVSLAPSLLERFPRLRLIEVVGEGRSANLYQLRPTREFIGNLSPESLLRAVRGRG